MKVATKSKTLPRVLVVQILSAVLLQHESLTAVLNRLLVGYDPRDKAWIQAMVYGVLRQFGELKAYLDILLKKPLRTKDRDIELLLLIGLHQLNASHTPDYAVVSESVNTAKNLGKIWAARLVNAILRQFLRQHQSLQTAIQSDPLAKYSVPAWLLQAIRQDWPEHWESILTASKQQAPMILRVNLSKYSRQDYMALLMAQHITAIPVDLADSAIALAQACDVKQLPGFATAAVAVQDTAAQLAAPLLQAQSGERILDACTAPGGKLCHLLEVQPDTQIIAVEQDANRMQRVQENLQRYPQSVQRRVKTYTADILQTTAWWDGQLFDRILLDVPCSASGVIRRHPDIKWLRRAADIPTLAKQQKKILTVLWSLLSPGGFLLYCTCSVLRQENDQIIAEFIQERTDAYITALTLPQAIKTACGYQLLPGLMQTDGFFYSGITKVKP